MKRAFVKLIRTFKSPQYLSVTEVSLYLYEFIEGFGGQWDWDDFTSVPIANPKLESIRLRARQVELPIDENGLGKLRRLLAETENLNVNSELSEENAKKEMQYIHLSPQSSPTTPVVKKPFAAVVVIATEVTPEWRYEISRWLVDEGCLCMMAWGNDCSLWDDSVDIAHLEAHNWEAIPDDQLLVTTWHDDEPLSDVFWNANMSNFDPPKVSLEHLVVLDIVGQAREKTLRELFQKSCNKF